MSVSRAEEEEVGVRVGARQLLALEPAEKRRGAAEPGAQRGLLGPAAGEHELEPRVARLRGEEGVGEQVDALLARQPARVQHPDAPVGHAGSQRGEKRATSTPRSQRPTFSRAMPSASSRASDTADGESTVSQPP